MTIAFIHNHGSFLPEIGAYHRYFTRLGFRCEEMDWKRLSSSRTRFDVEWVMMGSDMRSTTPAIRIHEYASASTPPFRSLKDTAKRWLNGKPHFRLFLNAYVKEQLGFADDVRFGFRDMGVDSAHERPTPVKGTASGNQAATEILTPTANRFDFVYAGSVAGQRSFHSLLDRFTSGTLLKYSILVLSRDYDELADRYRSYPNIRFEGPVPHAEVHHWLQQARYGINFIPDREPFSRQTSTKLLEYARQGLPVITTDYAWVREFEQQCGGSFYYLDATLSNLDPEKISGHKFSTPDLREWTWEKQIEKSGVATFLMSHGKTRSTVVG